MLFCLLTNTHKHKTNATRERTSCHSISSGPFRSMSIHTVTLPGRLNLWQAPSDASIPSSPARLGEWSVVGDNCSHRYIPLYMTRFDFDWEVSVYVSFWYRAPCWLGVVFVPTYNPIYNKQAPRFSLFYACQLSQDVFSSSFSILSRSSLLITTNTNLHQPRTAELSYGPITRSDTNIPVRLLSPSTPALTSALLSHVSATSSFASARLCEDAV